MSNVTIMIAGRRYTVACAPGEEGHIARLGRSISDRLSSVPDVASQSEPRMLLFASLLLADALHEAEMGHASSVAQLAEPLENLANQLEALASRLESPAVSS